MKYRYRLLIAILTLAAVIAVAWLLRPKTNLPAPVLADPLGTDGVPSSNVNGKARESTKVPPVGVSGQDSRGGQNLSI